MLDADAQPGRPGAPDDAALREQIGALEARIRTLRAEHMALQSECDFYRTIADYTHDWECWLSPDGTCLYSSPSCLTITGYSAAEFQSNAMLMLAIVYPDDRASIEAYLNDFVLGEKNQEQRNDLQFRIIRRDGSIAWISNASQPVLDSDGNYIGRRCSNRDITATKQMELALRESEERYRVMFEKNRAVKLLIDPGDGTIVAANSAAAAFYGYSQEALLRMRISDINLLPLEAIQQAMQQVIREQQSHFHFQHRLASGEIRDVEVHSSPLELGGRQLLYSIVHDVTARKQAEQQLQQKMQHLEQRNRQMLLLKHMADRFLVCANHQEVYQVIRSTCRRLFDGQSGALYLPEIGGSRLKQVVSWGDSLPKSALINWEDCLALQNRHSHMATSRSINRCRHNSWIVDTNALCVPLIAQGETLGLLTLYSSSICNEDEWKIRQQLAETVARQVTMALSNLAMRSRLQRQALQDGLTGLYNRRYLDETLPRELRRAARRRQPLGLIMLDIDYFKAYNDTYGHDVGDLLLQAVGAFLQSSVRAEDIACRYGGEEFLLMLPGASQEEAQRRAEDIRQGIANLRVQSGNQSLGAVTVSLGVASFPRHGSSADELVHRADLALYRAKARGRNQVHLAEAVAEP